MKMLALKIDDRCLSVAPDSSVLDAARGAGIRIPTLCHIKGKNDGAVCRVCVVESADGRLLTACDTPVQDGMVLFTDTEKVMSSRRMTLALMCENHRMDCDNCVRYNDCEFHRLCSHNGINSDRYETFTITPARDEGRCIVKDSSKCVLCRRCETACGLSLISVLGRGALTRVGTAVPLKHSGCTGCGQCVAACPTAALQPLDETRKVWTMLLKKDVLLWLLLPLRQRIY